jgi:hypothetical protein
VRITKVQQVWRHKNDWQIKHLHSFIFGNLHFVIHCLLWRDICKSVTIISHLLLVLTCKMALKPLMGFLYSLIMGLLCDLPRPRESTKRTASYLRAQNCVIPVQAVLKMNALLSSCWESPIYQNHEGHSLFTQMTHLSFGWEQGNNPGWLQPRIIYISQTTHIQEQRYMVSVLKYWVWGWIISCKE